MHTVLPRRGEIGRFCIRCNTLLSNRYRLRSSFTICDDTKLFPIDSKPINILICPKCGEVCFYIDDPEDVELEE